MANGEANKHFERARYERDLAIWEEWYEDYMSEEEEEEVSAENEEEFFM